MVVRILRDTFFMNNGCEDIERKKFEAVLRVDFHQFQTVQSLVINCFLYHQFHNKAGNECYKYNFVRHFTNA